MYYLYGKGFKKMNILTRDIKDEYNDNMAEYIDYVLQDRATPELRDGLYPVQRRVLYAGMNMNAYTLTKTANLVGSTTQFHPHGDAAITASAYKLSTAHQCKYPLLSYRGNLGSAIDDTPAQARYTSLKISKFCEDVVIGELKEFDKVADWCPSYDNSKVEPMFLTPKIPLLLVNGSSTIGIIESVHIPSHNLNEVIDETIKVITNPNYRVKLVPDHCQCCDIVDRDWQTMCDEGFGRYIVKGRIDQRIYVNPKNKSYSGLTVLDIRSAPNNVYISKVLDRLADMVKEKKVIGIAGIEENSSVNEIRSSIILAQGTDPEYIKSVIYRCGLKKTYSTNFRVYDVLAGDNRIVRMSYTDYIKRWFECRKLTKYRYCSSKFQKLKVQSHVTENYIWAIENGDIDSIIKDIKSNKSTTDRDLAEFLIKKYSMTDLQAFFILRCELKKLSPAYIGGFKTLLKNLKQEIKYYEDILLDERVLVKLICDELVDIKNKYGVKRTCKVVKNDSAASIPNGLFKIILTTDNRLHKVGVDDTSYVPNGKMEVVLDNTEDLLVFDTLGKVFCIPTYKIPFTNKMGVDIRIVNTNIVADVCSISRSLQVLQKHDPNSTIVCVSHFGYIKQMHVSEFNNIPPSGVLYTKLDDRDFIRCVLVGMSSGYNLLVTSSSKGILLHTKDIPLLKKHSRGNMTMSAPHIDMVYCMSEPFSDIIIVTASGMINRFAASLITQGRNKAGSNLIKLKKNDYIVGVCTYDPYEPEITIISTYKERGSDKLLSQCIPMSSIPVLSTISAGTKMLNSGIVNICCTM